MRIVIIGGGFGGVYTAKQLIHRAPQNVEIILIDEKDYVLYTPMLHEVATGGLQPRMVMEPLRNILHGPNFQLYTGRAEQIDFRRREILTDKGTVPYDIVVIATGSEPNFFLPGTAQYALPLKTLTDAKHIRNKIVETMHLIPKPVVTVVG
ncbi:MAG TPA: FAD-dependent oxidoreductase, partial [Candidatus Nanoarchaeia archaeon]|nr:FAD-dependent oxidoreductase [Candidatus Nanoarchaeia archaeon]